MVDPPESSSLEGSMRGRGNFKTDSLVISEEDVFNGNVRKIHEEPASGAPRPAYPIEEKPAGQTAPR
ncbi:MAG TPA: hypothetical protein VFV05_25890 [Methylomirabilota bacterium]|nr:hypothetical protein [Methylomirabilota bacterium]